MPTPPRFPIVGVGASAGGVEALEGFFRGMPEKPGLAVIVVTHLNPQRESILHEIITRFTDLTVEVAADEARIGENCVYVLPANAILSIKDGRLSIRRPRAAQRERKPIDIFFASLAEAYGEYAAGVVLSGGDSDGTLGIKAIKERGGLSMAQVPDGYGPHHNDMPRSAISTGFVDFALPADKMGESLAAFARGLQVLDAGTGQSNGTGEGEALEAARDEIYTILRNQVGHEFGAYKPKTFLRRVQRRMQVTQVEAVDAYLARLRIDPSEVAALFRDLLINVTNFFRDAGAFDSLAATVIPRLFEGRGANDAVRIWIPGCATGEEVYSIAILLREHMDTLSAVPRVQIFATDIDEHALQVARAARYPEQLLDSVSYQRRQRFFMPDGGTHLLTKEVRDLCIFSPHSVLRDPPFSRLDLISCRNLLIYFAGEAQRQVLPTFHYSLKPGGYLFLGMSENVSQFTELFHPLDKKHRIFRAREDAAPDFSLPTSVTSLRPAIALADARPRRGNGGGITIRHAVEAHVLDRFSPAHVVANRDGDVVYYSGRTGKYLEPAAGLPTRQLVNMARKGLRLDLRTTFREAVESGRMVTRESVAIEGDDGRVQMVTLTVDPLIERQGDEPLFLVLFADEGPSLSREEAQNRAGVVHDGATIALERELRDTRERLQSLIEEYETALEELKSSNEELVSLNEELQSTNEELEASKEELQSVNEELHTVNSELSSKVDALDRANSDLQNLFDSTEIATVFLDPKLVIRSFTPAVSKVFNILATDRGRPITDLASRFALPQLAEDVKKVIGDGEMIERRIEAGGRGPFFLVHIAAYRSSDQQIEGAVLTFVDITSHVLAEQRQGVMVAELQHRTRNLLGVVQSIADQTLSREGDGLDAFTDRLKALGRVQGLLSRAEDEPITIGALVRMELDALAASNGQDRIVLEGPEVVLRKTIVQTLALGIHELATNARKYGVLAMPEGRLSVTWRERVGEDGRSYVTLEWVEQGVTLKADPPSAKRQGYGRHLIEQALPYALGAQTSYELDRGNVRCRIDLPLTRSRGNGEDTP